MAKTVHEVEQRSNLYFLLNGFIGALNRFADAHERGLNAIALALSTPHDNSAEVKALTEKLKAQTDQLQQAVNNQ